MEKEDTTQPQPDITANNELEEPLPPVCWLAKLSSIWLVAIAVIALGILFRNYRLIRTAQLLFIASMLLGVVALIYIFINRLFHRKLDGAIFAVIAIIISIICQAIFLPAFIRARKPDTQHVNCVSQTPPELKVSACPTACALGGGTLFYSLSNLKSFKKQTIIVSIVIPSAAEGSTEQASAAG